MAPFSRGSCPIALTIVVIAAEAAEAAVGAAVVLVVVDLDLEEANHWVNISKNYKS